MGFYGIGFSRMVPCGRGKALADSFLTAQELKSAYQKIISLNSPSFEVVSGDPLAGTLFETKVPSGCNLTLSGCSAGFSGVTITGDGAVMPCRRIGLVAGNLKKKSLRAIWASSKLLWQLRKRESYQGKCGRCSLWPSDIQLLRRYPIMYALEKVSRRAEIVEKRLNSPPKRSPVMSNNIQ